MGDFGLTQKIYGQLTTFKDFIPEDFVPETFINLYHGILDELEGIGEDMMRFRIHDWEIGTCPETSELECDSALFLEKIEDILTLFTRTRIGKNGIPEIGFSQPETSS